MEARGAAMTDAAEFARLTEPFRAELLAHCYRMLGSVHDAEDLVQETLIRAWRSYDDFEGRARCGPGCTGSPPTRACGRWRTAAAGRCRPGSAPRAEPGRAPAAAGPRGAVAGADPGRPDAGRPRRPRLGRGVRAGLRLALIAALQYLPARQRAVLILRDVLQLAGGRGRRPARHHHDRGEQPAAAGPGRLEQAGLAAGRDPRTSRRRPARAARPVRRGVRERRRRRPGAVAARGRRAGDAADARPGSPAGTRIVRFLATRVSQPGDFTMLPVAANGQPGFAATCAGRRTQARPRGVAHQQHAGYRLRRTVEAHGERSGQAAAPPRSPRTRRTTAAASSRTR